MRQNFETCTDWLLIHEGGFVNHPKDPGGATNKGVTQRVYDGYRRRKNLPEQSVRYISDVEVKDIYKTQYWDTIMGDLLPSGVDYAVYDFAVNSGPSRAVKFLQNILGVKEDGVMGNITLSAINDPYSVIFRLCEKRWEWLKTLKTYSTFGRGWTRRVMGEIPDAQPGSDTGVIDRAIMLHEGYTNIPSPTEAYPGKAEEEDKKLGQKIKDGLTLENAAKVSGGAIPALGVASQIPDGPLQWALAAVLVIGILTVSFVVLKKTNVLG